MAAAAPTIVAPAVAMPPCTGNTAAADDDTAESVTDLPTATTDASRLALDALDDQPRAWKLEASEHLLYSHRSIRLRKRAITTVRVKAPHTLLDKAATCLVDRLPMRLGLEQPPHVIPRCASIDPDGFIEIEIINASRSDTTLASHVPLALLDSVSDRKSSLTWPSTPPTPWYGRGWIKKRTQLLGNLSNVRSERQPTVVPLRQLLFLTPHNAAISFFWLLATPVHWLRASPFLLASRQPSSLATRQSFPLLAPSQPCFRLTPTRFFWPLANPVFGSRRLFLVAFASPFTFRSREATCLTPVAR